MSATAVAKPMAALPLAFSVTVNRDELAKELTLCSAAVKKQSTLKILECVLLSVSDGMLNLKTTDLELTIAASIESAGDDDGIAAIALSTLNSFVRQAPAEAVTIACDERAVVLSSGATKFTTATLSPIGFPDDPRTPTDESPITIATMKLGVLREMLRATVYAVDDGVEQRWNMAGCLLSTSKFMIDGKRWNAEAHGIEIAATNGKHVACASTSDVTVGDFAHGRMLTTNMVKAIIKLPSGDDDDCALSATNNGTFVTVGSRVLMDRTVDMNFPRWRQVIDVVFDAVAEIDTAALMAATKRVLMGADEGGRGVVFSFSKGKLKLSADFGSVRSAEELVVIDYSGEPTDIKMGGNLMVEMLEVIGTERLRWSLPYSFQVSRFDPVPSSDKQPPLGVEHLHVIVPMRINA